jgi:Holliday junction resolvase RusA-like endonuclease
VREARFVLPGVPQGSNRSSGRHWSRLRSERGPQREWRYLGAVAVAHARRTGAWDGRPFVAVDMEARFWLPDRRRRDLDGLMFGLKGAIDALQPSVIPDDDWQHVRAITAVAAGVDRANPRVEITLREVPA